MEEQVRQLARKEVASLCGLVLRRLENPSFTRSFERNAAIEEIHETFSAIFGEALRDFGGTQTEPGA
jgi:hypothetical protein